MKEPIEGAPRVMIVDDEPLIREIVRRVLQAEGMHVTDFGDPHAALKFSLDQPPDLAILDVFMPGMSGLELARRIRQKHSQVRVLFCSGSLGPDGQLPGGEVLAEPFLQKPFDLDVLRQMVGACLRVAEVA